MTKIDVMVLFLKKFPNGSFKDFLEYYENFINDEFEKYKRKQLKILNKGIK